MINRGCRAVTRVSGRGVEDSMRGRSAFGGGTIGISVPVAMVSVFTLW